MEKFEDYLDRAKDLAEDAGGMAKSFVGDVVDKAKDLIDEHEKVKELTRNAKEQAASISLGAKEMVSGLMQDAKAGKEIKQGISELEALPEVEGSILYNMELQAMINDLSSLLLIIGDKRLDDASVIEELQKVMNKVQPSAEAQIEAADQQAIEKAKEIAYSACTRALAALNQAAG